MDIGSGVINDSYQPKSELKLSLAQAELENSKLFDSEE